MIEDEDSTGLSLKGDLYFKWLKNGVAQPRIQIPGIAQLELKSSVDTQRLQSNGKHTKGMVVAQKTVKKPTELTIKMQEFNGLAMGFALMGEAIVITQNAGNAVAEPITAILGSYVDLAHKNVIGSVVLTNSAATTTYVEGTDYEINAAQGWIKALRTGGITDAQALKVTYAYGARAGWGIDAETIDQFEGELFLDGENLADGSQVELTIWKASFASGSAIDYLSDKFVDMSFSGGALLLAGKNSPYRLEKIRNA